jgi:hypothetical protein
VYLFLLVSFKFRSRIVSPPSCRRGTVNAVDQRQERVSGLEPGKLEIRSKVVVICGVDIGRR